MTAPNCAGATCRTYPCTCTDTTATDVEYGYALARAREDLAQARHERDTLIRFDRPPADLDADLEADEPDLEKRLQRRHRARRAFPATVHDGLNAALADSRVHASMPPKEPF